MSVPSRLSTNYGWSKNFNTLSAVMLGLKHLVNALDAKIFARGYIYVPFSIPATELSAGTTIEIVSPVVGTIIKLQTIVQTAIVTGGVITVKIGTIDVLGLSVTVADAATKGTVITDIATGGDSTDDLVVGSRIQIVPSAAFNGGGEIRGMLTIQIA